MFTGSGTKRLGSVAIRLFLADGVRRPDLRLHHSERADIEFPGGRLVLIWTRIRFGMGILAAKIKTSTKPLRFTANRAQYGLVRHPQSPSYRSRRRCLARTSTISGHLTKYDVSSSVLLLSSRQILMFIDRNEHRFAQRDVGMDAL
jgi:hypothetical protein